MFVQIYIFVPTIHFLLTLSSPWKLWKKAALPAQGKFLHLNLLFRFTLDFID